MNKSANAHDHDEASHSAALERLAPLEDVWWPIWVFDPLSGKFLWANKAAVKFWRAESADALLKRDFLGMTESSRTRLMATLSRLELFNEHFDQWTFYPEGVPTTCRVRRRLIELDRDHTALINEAVPVTIGFDPITLRGMEALNHTFVAISLFDSDGRVLMRNPAAVQLFGPPNEPDSESTLGGGFIEDYDREHMWEMLRSEGHYQKELEVLTLYGRAWHSIDIRTTHDPLTGFKAFLVNQEDISRRKETEQALIDAKFEAERANKAKSSFLANMSHELRTPMTGVLGVIDLFKTMEFDEEATKLMNTLSDSAQLLTAVLNDLLDFSKIEAGQLVIEDIPFDPRSVAQYVIDLMRPRAEVKNIGLTLEVDSLLPQHVSGDPTRLRQILLNLVSNAVKFTEKGGVSLKIGYWENTAHFAIRDSGIGMSDDQLAKLFKPFSQADTSTTRKYGGTGLGLAICRRLCELMNGKIRASSEAGHGTVFEVELPMPKVTVIATENKSREMEKVAPGIKVLLAEDNSVNGKLISTMLGKRGYEMTWVQDGKQALDKIASGEKFAIVLMDIQMPVMDGITATKQIRKLPGELGTLPIVALTADALREDIEKFQTTGLDDYMTKPVDWKRLFETIDRLTNRLVVPVDQTLGTQNLR